MGKRISRFNNWRKSTYLSAMPIFGAGTGGELMQSGPLAIISSLIGEKEEQKQPQQTQTIQRKGKCPSGGEIYVFQNERFDLVVRDWECEDEYFDETYLNSLAEIFNGYLEDPLNERDHAWAHM